MADIIEAMRHAFEAFSSGHALAPVRTALQLPEGTTLTMPAALPQVGTTSVKIVSVYPSNPERALPAVLGIVAVLDAATGEPLALMDGTYLTGYRTGAASGLATDLLARQDSRVLALIGAGYQARFQAEAVLAVRPIEEVRMYTRSPEHRDRFVAELTASLGADGPAVRAVSTSAAAVSGADVICTATSSHTPVLTAEDVSPDTHLNGVGSYTLQMQEVPLEVVRRARVWVDSREAARAEAGDLAPAVDAGLLVWDSLPELGEVLLGKREGRRDEREITFFKSVGLAVQDVSAAGLLARRAGELGLGQELRSTS